MDQERFERFMEATYKSTLSHYRRRAIQNQQLYRWLTWLTVLLSAVTAILVGLEPFFDWLPIKLSAVVTSITVSSLATALKTFNFQEKWASYNKMRNEFENEYDLYQADAESYATADDKESYFVVRIRGLINQHTNSMKYGTARPDPLSI